LVNEPYAKVEIFYNCVFQGKTSAGLSVDEFGRVTLTPQETITNLPMTGLGAGTVTNLAPSGAVVQYDNAGDEHIVSDTT